MVTQNTDYRPRFEWRFLGPRFWPIWLTVALLGLMLYLPAGVRNRLARLVGRHLLARHQKRRRIVTTNLEWCFPNKTAAERAKMLDRYYFYAARAILDYALFWFATRRHVARKVRLVNEDYLLQYAEAQRVIILTCHTLGLEYGALAITQRLATVGLIKPARNPLFEWLVSRGRTRFHGRLFDRNTGLRPIVHAIRTGQRFYYLPDEDLGGSQQTTFASFFGVPTATLTSLGRLARMCEAVVVPCITYLDEASDQYVVHFFPPETDFSSGDEQGDSEHMNRLLEVMIGQAPEQYMWSLRLFQTRPKGEASPYN